MQHGPKALAGIHNDLEAWAHRDTEKAVERVMSNCVWKHFPPYLNHHEEIAAEDAMQGLRISVEDDPSFAHVSCMSRRMFHLVESLLRTFKYGVNIMRPRQPGTLKVAI